jgi:hypothetical protein
MRKHIPAVETVSSSLTTASVRTEHKIIETSKADFMVLDEW